MLIVLTIFSGVCRFNRAPEYPSPPTPIWIENLSCSSNASCSHDGYGITDCTHSKDVAISCRSGMDSIDH